MPQNPFNGVPQPPAPPRDQGAGGRTSPTLPTLTPEEARRADVQRAQQRVFEIDEAVRRGAPPPPITNQAGIGEIFGTFGRRVGQRIEPVPGQLDRVRVRVLTAVPAAGVTPVDARLIAHQQAREAAARFFSQLDAARQVERVIDPIPFENEIIAEFVANAAVLEKPIEMLLDVGFVGKKVIINAVSISLKPKVAGVGEEAAISLREDQERALRLATNTFAGVVLNLTRPDQTDPGAPTGPPRILDDPAPTDPKGANE